MMIQWKRSVFLTLVTGFWFASCSSGIRKDDCKTDKDCSDGRFCVEEKCVECRYTSDCKPGQECQLGVCVKGCPSDDRCETGGSCCPGDWECVDRVCLAPCSGIRCGYGSELCCEQGFVCEDDRCQIDCGTNPRCGQDHDVCCTADQICYGFSCTTPGDQCVQQSDCEPDQICERDLGICLDKEVIGDCQYHPPVGEFEPEVDCRWTPPANHVNPERNDVVMAPMVANLTDDNQDGKTDTLDVPDIVFSSYDYEMDGCCEAKATLRIVSGACNPDGTMYTHFSINDPIIDNSGGIALGDLDGDGVPEIVAMMNNDLEQPQGTVAFKRVADDGSNWEVLWQNDTYPTWNVHTSRGGAQPSLADLNADGYPEVIVGNVALRGTDGSLYWDGLVEVGPTAGVGNNAFLGPVSSVTDIDLDDKPEVLAGNTCYSYDGQKEWTFEYTSDNSPCHNGNVLPCDGYTASGNFDEDDEGEVVIVRLGEVFVLNHDGSLLNKVVIPTGNCTYNESGPPTVADFDNDGKPEIGTAAADYYIVVDLDCIGDPWPAGCAADGVLWYVPNQDCSSRVTASSVFDFDGDGQAEVVYADETTFRILDGKTGTELFVDETHGSHTRLEMVVIADVDNDGNAEVVIAENASHGGTPGVEVWGDRLDNWVFTRRIWNQHSYHVTNITESGIVPSYEQPNWLQSHLNNFRQNIQGEGLFWAPDLVIDNLNTICETDLSLYISFDVVNQGSRMVGPGAATTLYADATAIHTLRTTQPLFPGQFEHVTYSWKLPTDMHNVPFTLKVATDDSGDGTGEHNECEDGGEDNNTSEKAGIICGPVE